MRVTTAMLADHAEAVGGKVYVTGGAWNRLVVNSVPARHPHMSLVVVFEVGWDETNTPHMLDIRFFDADDHQIGPALGGEINAGRPPTITDGESQNVGIVFHLNLVPIENVGPHRFEIRVDGSTLAELPVYVTVRKPAPRSG